MVVVPRFRTAIEGAFTTVHGLRTSLVLSYAAVQSHFRPRVLTKSRATSCVQHGVSVPKYCRCLRFY